MKEAKDRVSSVENQINTKIKHITKNQSNKNKSKNRYYVSDSETTEPYTSQSDFELQNRDEFLDSEIESEDADLNENNKELSDISNSESEQSIHTEIEGKKETENKINNVELNSQKETESKEIIAEHNKNEKIIEEVNEIDDQDQLQEIEEEEEDISSHEEANNQNNFDNEEEINEKFEIEEEIIENFNEEEEINEQVICIEEEDINNESQLNYEDNLNYYYHDANEEEQSELHSNDEEEIIENADLTNSHNEKQKQ